MKKFKLFFYPIYLIFALGVIYFSLDSLFDMEPMLTWFNEKFTLENQPYLVMGILLFMGILMVTEMIIENIQISRVKEEIPDLEDEIVRLKAKLYDQSTGDDDEEEDGDDEDEDDD